MPGLLRILPSEPVALPTANLGIPKFSHRYTTQSVIIQIPSGIDRLSGVFVDISFEINQWPILRHRYTLYKPI